MPPFPIARYLVPADPPAPDDRFTTIAQSLDGGLPAAIPIDKQLSLIVQLPTGLGAAWRDADPGALVTTSDWETSPVDPAALPSRARAALRVEVRRNNRTSAVVSVVAGRRMLVSDGSTPGVCYEVWISAWTIYAGSLAGAGSYGSRIALAWRRSDAAVQQFATPPPNIYILPRLGNTLKFQSWLNFRPLVPLTLESSIALRRGAIDDATAANR
jgi:hypothetical protein